jgi:hypothetical protein
MLIMTNKGICCVPRIINHITRTIRGRYHLQVLWCNRPLGVHEVSQVVCMHSYKHSICEKVHILMLITIDKVICCVSRIINHITWTIRARYYSQIIWCNWPLGVQEASQVVLVHSYKHSICEKNYSKADYDWYSNMKCDTNYLLYHISWTIRARYHSRTEWCNLPLRVQEASQVVLVHSYKHSI